jgi:hypothetical protein
MIKRVSFIASLVVVAVLQPAPITFLPPNVLNVASGFTISSTGLYQLTDDVVFTNLANSQNGITITSSSVTLDLNGRALTGISGATGQSAISIAPGGYTNIRIKNGSINNWSANGIISTGVLKDLFLEKLNIQYTLGAAGSGSVVLSSTTQRAYIRNCTMGGNPVADGIRMVSGGFSIEISGCTMNNIGGACCNLQTATTVIIQRCRFNSGAVGLYAGASSALYVVNSFMNLNTGLGIQLVQTGSSLVLGCTVEKNTGGGISVDAGSGANLIKGCVALSNGGAGFTNNSTNSAFMSCLATRNTSTNYAGTGPIGAISIFNGVSVPLGTAIDGTNNIAIYGQTS